MPGFIGTLITVLIVTGLVVLAVRSLRRGRKSGCGCGRGEKCAACGGCACKETRETTK